jgi:tetratricopeptide (TPR) repeat protein
MAVRSTIEARPAARRAPAGHRRGRSGSAARALLLAGLIASPAAAGVLRSGARAPVDGAIESGLRALHQGEFARAVDGFERAARESPGAPEPLFFVVFSRWWQIILGEAPASQGDPAFEQGVESTLRAARARLEAAPADAAALAVLGGAHVLRSHLEAVRGNYFRSGQEARRGKKALEQALRIDGGLDMALFPAGALNYFADRVPLIVKGLRPLFLFPGGDAGLGLRQIRQVAEGHGPFRTDGRLLLAQICSDRYQRGYREALDHFAVALDENPGSPLIAAAIGDLQIRIGEYRAAAGTLTAALRGAAGDGPERSRQRRWLLLGLAEAQMGDWSLEEAAATLRRALQEPAPSSPALRRTARRLEEELRQRLDALPLLRSTDATPVRRPPAATGDDVRQEVPGRAIEGLLRGRTLLAAGRPEEAILSLREAAGAANGDPPWLAGWIELLSGDAERRLGHEKGARAHYRRASGIRHFRAADRGRLEIGEKGEDADVCAPGAPS